MSDGVIIEGKRIIYGHTRSQLPAIFSDGELQWVMWGERREGDFYPHGGWVNPGELKTRSWRPWRPKEVLIPADGFMVHKPGGGEEWFPLAGDQGIRGMVVCSDDECRIYIATTSPPQAHNWARRWPEVVRLVQGKKPVANTVSRPRPTEVHAKT